jgi:hypothetical protein
MNLFGENHMLSKTANRLHRSTQRPTKTRPYIEVLEDRSTPASTTTSLIAIPNATTGGELITFTATVAPSPDTAGTVTFRDSGAAIPGGSDVALFDGIAIFATDDLAVGTHLVTAAYSGAAGFDASTSPPVTVAVAAPPSAPQIVSIVPNGGLPGLEGPQRSRMLNMQYTFDQAVALDTDAVTVSLHTNGVVFGGVVQQNGRGAVPKLVLTPSAGNTVWTVTFSGSSTDIGRVDGRSSLKDGVYDFHVDASKVHPLGSSAVSMISDSSLTVHRLFGDIDTPSTPSGGAAGVDFAAVVNSRDNLPFRTAFRNPGHYQPYFDDDGNGVINSADTLAFRNRFNKVLLWKA